MESPHREPTVAELKEERRIIERDLHLSSPVPNALISSKVPVHGPILPIFRRAEFNQRVKLDDSHSRGVICELVHVSSHISLPFSDVKCSKSLGKTQLKVSRSFSGSLDHLVVQSSDVLRSQNDCSAGRSSYRVSIPISEDTEFTEINQSHGMSEKLHSEKVISKGIDLTRSKKRIPHVDQMREKSRTQDPCHTAPFPLSFKIGLTPHRTLQATDVVLAPTPPPVQRPALKPSSSIRRGRLIQQDNVAS
ncbi:uncharacterized protein LOC122813186 [Protopterus annectens]|uniref:uncharacterized protein LOC122813186 n=1 Tax=Protopterus annectens TaxID=7888 RepID=UPI001CF9405B|nr:uncharacterized protein LOC122813186 [Protopterus annectens]